MTFRGVEILRETKKAFLVWLSDFRTDEWIPKSQVAPDQRNAKPGGTGDLDVTEWFGQILMEKLRLKAAQPDNEPPIDPELVPAHQVYRKLAAKYHPDREGGDAEVMRDLNILWQAMKKAGSR